MKQQPKFDTVAWAKAARVQNARKCCVCTLPKDALAAVNLIGEMRIKGETEVSQPMIADMLSNQYGVTVNVASLQRHYRACQFIHWGTAQRLRK